jgi:transcriptional regulator with XRE-family HTH domain
VKFTEKFGANIRARREALGISQEELAARTGLHRTYIGSVERGERNISLHNILRVASALGCLASDLLKDLTLREDEPSD